MPILLFVVASLLTWCLPLTASAEPLTLEGRYRFSLGMEVLNFASTEIDPEGSGPDTELTSWELGLPSDAVVSRVGYAISPNLVIGGAFAFSYSSSEQEQSGQSLDTTASELRLAPRLEYYLGDGGLFLSGELGLSRAAQETDGATSQEITQFGFYARAGIGARYFLTPALSVEPEAAVGYFSLSGEQEQGGASVDFDATGPTFTLGVALSLWP